MGDIDLKSVPPTLYDASNRILLRQVLLNELVEHIFVMSLDESSGTHWGNAPLRNRVFEIKPKYHLFGHAHDAFGTEKQEGIVFSNAAMLDDNYKSRRKGKLFIL